VLGPAGALRPRDHPEKPRVLPVIQYSEESLTGHGQTTGLTPGLGAQGASLSSPQGMVGRVRTETGAGPCVCHRAARVCGQQPMSVFGVGGKRVSMYKLADSEPVCVCMCV
jgi:hypothetical protein